MVRVVRGLAIVVIELVCVQWQVVRASDGNYTAGWDPESRDEGVVGGMRAVGR
ncbi:hypothetical protein IG631_15160 [Alternaria alternata]|jgi:hypothetical protein|nr:hypothetical protein IG631_15160 [Alternaria alternata]